MDYNFKEEAANKSYKRFKKIIIISFVVLVLLIVGLKNLYNYGKVKALSTIPASGKMTFTVKLNSITLDHNNSVGNEWGFKATINGTTVEDGKEITISANTNDNISFSAMAEEYDTIPDIGSGGANINTKDLKLTEKNTCPIEVTVTENRGRYSGNTAEWIFNFVIERKVNSTEILSSIF